MYCMNSRWRWIDFHLVTKLTNRANTLFIRKNLNCTTVSVWVGDFMFILKFGDSYCLTVTVGRKQTGMKVILKIGEDYFQLFNWFQLFFCLKRNSKNCRTVSQNRSKITLLKEGVDGFSYFHWFSVKKNYSHNHPWKIQ